MQKFLYTIATFLLFSNIYSQTTPSLILTQFATGFSLPLGIEHCGDNRLFIVQQRGLIKILNRNGTTNSANFLDISLLVSSSGSERGLLGLAFHPNYAGNGYFYVNYTRQSDGATCISRFSRNPADSNDALENSEEILLTIAQPFSNHNGGQIRFGSDGYLYIGMGDGGSSGDPQENGQAPLALLGKMLRIDVDKGTPYSSPPSNPFYGMANVRNEIWAMGMRNPWRFSFDRCTKDLWIADVGQNILEEVDFEPAGDAGGHNYGWDCYEGNNVFEATGCGAPAGFTFPIYEYVHSTANGCSVTGGFVYRGGIYGGMFGWYLFTDYCSGRFWGTHPNDTGGWNTSVLTVNITITYSYSTLGEDNDGELYIASQSNGRIYKISDTTCLPTAFITPNNLKACQGDTSVFTAITANGNTYQWSRNGNEIIGATQAYFLATEAGAYTLKVTNANNCSNVSDTIFFNPFLLPLTSFSGLNSNYNINHAPSILTGFPAGGTFIGKGVNGNTFDPSVAGLGTHQIIYCFTDSNGCTGCDTNSTIVSPRTMVEEIRLGELNMFPSPAENMLYLNFYASGRTGMTLSFFNATGQLMRSEQKTVAGGMNKFQTDISTFSAGVYIAQLQCDSGTTRKRFVVRK